MQTVTMEPLEMKGPITGPAGAPLIDAPAMETTAMEAPTAEEVPTGETPTEESPAVAFLAHLRANAKGNPVEQVTVDGAAWYIRRLNFPQQAAIGSHASRAAKAPSLRDVSTQERTLSANALAVLAACVATDATGGRDFFDIDFDDAGEVTGTIVEFVDSADSAALVAELFARSIEYNPGIFRRK